MSIDKFKNLKPVKHKFNIDDTEYVNTLNTLPQREAGHSIWRVLGTVAAAVAIVTVVALWALIGRGLRGNVNNGAQIIPSSRTELEITDELKSQFKTTAKQYGFAFVPVFDEEQPPSVWDTIRYMFYLDVMLTIDYDEDTENLYGFENNFVSGKVVNDFGEKNFGCDIGATPTQKYCTYTEFETTPLTLTSLVSYDTTSGTQYYTVEFSDKNGKTYTLSYTGESHTEPKRFVSMNNNLKNYYNYAEDKMLYAIMDRYSDVPELKDGKLYVFNATKLSDTLYACSIRVVGQSPDFDIRNYAARYWAENFSSAYLNVIYFDKDGESFTVSDNQQRIPPLVMHTFVDQKEYSTEFYLTNQFNSFADKYKLWALPVFNEGEDPDTQALVNYAYLMAPELFTDRVITPQMLSDFVWEYFAIERDYSAQDGYSAQDVEYIKPQLVDNYNFRTEFDLDGGIYTYSVNGVPRTVIYYSDGNAGVYCFVCNAENMDGINALLTLKKPQL